MWKFRTKTASLQEQSCSGLALPPRRISLEVSSGFFITTVPFFFSN